MGKLRENLPSARPSILKIGQNMADILTSRRKNRVQASCGRLDGGRLGRAGRREAAPMPAPHRAAGWTAAGLGRGSACPTGQRPERQGGGLGESGCAGMASSKKKARPHRVLRRPPPRLGQACRLLPAGLLPSCRSDAEPRLGRACRLLPRLVVRIGAAAGCRSVPAAALPGCRGLSIALAPQQAACCPVPRSGMAVRAPAGCRAASQTSAARRAPCATTRPSLGRPHFPSSSSLPPSMRAARFRAPPSPCAAGSRLLPRATPSQCS